MKFLKRLTLLPLICILPFTAVGCKKTTYHFYTNVPQSGFELVDKSFEVGEIISGLNVADRNFEEKDTSAYTSRNRLYTAMGVDAQLIISADFTKEGAQDNYAAFTKSIFNLLENVEKALSPTVTGSDILNFNNAEAGETVEISHVTYEVLTIASDVYDLTEGYYNPALYYNVLAYGFGTARKYPQSAADLPDDSAIEKYTELAKSFGEITLSENNGKYTVTKPAKTVEVNGETLSLKLDLGGIGKGYAVDKIDELFDLYGYEYGYFSYASSSMLFKSNVKEGNYTLQITSPRSNTRDEYMRVPARNEKLSTSGDNEQRYFIDGVRYCHIIDPTTGKPVRTGIMSATVIGGSAAEDDALTTAIMAMGKDRAIKFIEEKLTDRRVVFTVE
ncbi:MAG: FAD:protein FMN transferase [Clostridia bacterium]|nr:FAD:protein FMN transferase [Clostridia bacterium]